MNIVFLTSVPYINYLPIPEALDFVQEHLLKSAGVLFYHLWDLCVILLLVD